MTREPRPIRPGRAGDAEAKANPMETPTPPPILELRPGAPVVVRTARRWVVRLAVLGVLGALGTFAWFGFWHVLALGRFESRGATVSFRDDDSAIRGFLTINCSMNASYRVGDDDLPPLRDVFWLRSLDLSRCDGVTDAGLDAVAAVKPLRELYLTRSVQPWDPDDKTLYGPKITDAGLARLRGLTQLQSLSLEGTGITDAGLDSLSGMTRLDTIDLSNTAITDAGLARLRGLKSLRVLRLEATAVTCEGRADFMAAMPDVVILMPRCNADEPEAYPSKRPSP